MDQRPKLLGTYTSTVMAGGTRCTRSRFFSKFVNASTALAKQYLEQSELKHSNKRRLMLWAQYTDSSVRRLGSSTRRPSPDAIIRPC